MEDSKARAERRAAKKANSAARKAVRVAKAAKKKTKLELTDRELTGIKSMLSGVLYRGVLDDLEAFTGFTKAEICLRVIKKKRFGYGAAGWFNEEFAYFHPVTLQEYDWFYRASQIYLFSNARRRHWVHIDGLTAKDQPILDYGAGIGQNPLELHYRGMKDSWYFEVGSLQTEFFRFRMRRHGFEPKVIEPYHAGKFDTVGCLVQAPMFRTVILQDVLEHVHRYDLILEGVVGRLARGGTIIEHSPFAVADNTKITNERTTRMHLMDKVGLEKCMARLGMVLESAGAKGPKGFEVRTWKKN
jgi:hypothetical protein